MEKTLTESEKNFIKDNAQLIVDEGSHQELLSKYKEEKDDDLNIINIFAFIKEHVKINIFSGIKSIPKGIFFKDEEIQEFDIPDGVQEIEEGAFYNSSIRYVKIPPSLEHIGKIAFKSSSLNTVEFSMQNSSLKIIEDRAFEDCYLKKVEFPDGIEHIGKYAFYKNLLENVTFNPNQTKDLDIYARAFEEQNGSLKYVDVPSYVFCRSQEIFPSDCQVNFV